PRMIRMAMDVEAVMRAALVEAGYGPDAVGSALPRIMRILQAEDVRLEVGRPLSRKEREYVPLQLEIGLSVPEIVAALKRCGRGRSRGDATTCVARTRPKAASGLGARNAPSAMRRLPGSLPSARWRNRSSKEEGPLARAFLSLQRAAYLRPRNSSSGSTLGSLPRNSR